jgi:cytosine/adenosine deaminase-related metal-dependent hydrolase
MRLTAQWICPVDRPPLQGGVVTIASGRIVAVESAGVSRADLDLGDAVLLPGLVNAHTHLDLTGLRGRTPPGADFAAWLRCVVAGRRAATPQSVLQDVRAGLAECLDSGTTLIGDIAAGGASWDVLVNAPCRSVVFYELLGLSKPRAGQAWSRALDWLRNHPATSRCRPGLSPHAPYSVRASLFRAAGSLACSLELPVAVHAAESMPERELLESRSGPLVEFLREMGVYDPGGLIGSFGELRALTSPAPGRLLVHGNYFRLDELAGEPGHIVYCPRTHLAFGHTPYPLTEFLRAGVRVALGTDSLASNPDLSLLAEAQFVHASHPDVSPHAILRMATLEGAGALGWAEECGSLTPGKAADLAVIRPGPTSRGDPAERVLGPGAKIAGVMIAGKWRRDPGASAR